MLHTLLVLASLPMTALGVTLPGPQGAASWDLALEGGAAVVPDAALGADALLLDGSPGSYARCPAPATWGRLRNFRLELRVRLDEFRASTIPIAWPGAFRVYISGQGKPWLWVETDAGRSIYAAEEIIGPTQWCSLTFEYRADDYGLLSINGRSVLSFGGAGPLKQGGPDVWFGRYDYTDPQDGKRHEAWMKGAVALPRLAVLPDDDRIALDTTGLSNAMNVSWGDAIVVNKGWRMLNRPEHVAPFVAECQRLGVKTVFLRSDHYQITTDFESRMSPDHWYMKAINAVQGDMMAELITGCHAAEIQVLAYQSIFDLGSPVSVLYGGSAPFPWQSKFTIEHPEYLMESRDGTKRQWGVLCYAYPEARKYIIGTFKRTLDRWPFDGLYICTRTHSYPAEFADQFGYNPPIADEFRRRYGVDIRTQDFSKSRWWDLQGEYLTQLLREFRSEFPNKPLVFAMPRADFIGPPYGNMRLDWRTWLQEKLVDGLVLGVISGGGHYPNTRNLPGYVQSQQDNVGMRDLDYDLGQWFGPACKDAGVELYLQRSAIFSDADRDLLKHPGMTGFMVGF